MKALLITSDNCQPCTELKEQFRELIDKGEITEVNFEKESERVTELINKYDADMPSLLILSDDGELILKT